MNGIFLHLWPEYDPGPFFCELTTNRHGAGPVPQWLVERLHVIGLDALRVRVAAAETDLIDLGVTFTVYSDATEIDRILPFDCIPHVLTAPEWDLLERACSQRLRALKLFLDDIYRPGHVVKDGVIPAELVYGNANYRPEMKDFTVPHGGYVHVCGIDISRDEKGSFRVLEDNVRAPSGVSYVIENRRLMLRAFPDLVSDIKLMPVDDHGRRLRAAMAKVAPDMHADPQVVLLSSGIYNAAYFKHVFLAREMGVPLVVGADLVVEDDRVVIRTTSGLKPVHTIYRCLNDDFLDQELFRSDSMLGVLGLIRVWKEGNAAIANAVGAGVADDKAVYAYMPRIIEYYLGGDPLIRNVGTHICREAEGLLFTLENLGKLVTKPVGKSGGYGITIGPRASNRTGARARDRFGQSG
ncbi:circularly permuted type 2 ATP-grasp protein [Acidocella sp.]|uniref:circularly permuted type 2 ATP-grasp protein n=1 Tax=Acidocella sp. TaxID=50710 RepID=UPI0038CFE9A7